MINFKPPIGKEFKMRMRRLFSVGPLPLQVLASALLFGSVLFGASGCTRRQQEAREVFAELRKAAELEDELRVKALIAEGPFYRFIDMGRGHFAYPQIDFAINHYASVVEDPIRVQSDAEGLELVGWGLFGNSSDERRRLSAVRFSVDSDGRLKLFRCGEISSTKFGESSVNHWLDRENSERAVKALSQDQFHALVLGTDEGEESLEASWREAQQRHGLSQDLREKVARDEQKRVEHEAENVRRREQQREIALAKRDEERKSALSALDTARSLVEQANTDLKNLESCRDLPVGFEKDLDLVRASISGLSAQLDTVESAIAAEDLRGAKKQAKGVEDSLRVLIGDIWKVRDGSDCAGGPRYSGAREESKAETRASTATGPLQVAANITAPVRVSGPEAQYTQAARNAQIQGVVILQVVVDEGGNVTEAKVLKGLPFGLEESATAAVKQWKFRPAMQDGKAVAAFYNLRVTFELDR